MTRHTAPRRHTARHLAAAAATAVIVATSVLTAGAVGSVVAQPRAEAPAAAAVRAPAVGRRSTVGASELAGGLSLAPGLRVLGSPRGTTDAQDYRRWEADVDLGTVPAAAALDDLAATLAASGFDVRRGSDDVFGARRSDGRWQIVVARVREVGSGEDVTDVLALAIGSRAA